MLYEYEFSSRLKLIFFFYSTQETEQVDLELIKTQLNQQFFRINACLGAESVHGKR